MTVGGQTSIALAKPLPAFGDGERAILLLAYPKAEALADARKLQLALAVMTLLGLRAGRARHLAAAARITQPLARLDDAAGRLASGEHVQVRGARHRRARAARRTASTKWSARSPSASSGSPSSPSTTC